MKRYPQFLLAFAALCLQSSALFANAAEAVTYPNAELTGRVQIDSGWTLHHDSTSPRLENQADFRRIRFNLEGDLYPDWHYRLQADTRLQRQELIDAILSYHGMENTVIRAGHFLEYSGLEAFASNRDLLLLERAEFIHSFRSFRSLGLGVERFGQGWGLQLGAFGDDMNASAPDKGGLSLGGRGYVLPIHTDENLLHLGLNLRTRSDIDRNQARFRSRGTSAQPEASLIDTGWIRHIDHQDTYGLELYATHGPFALAAEYQQNILYREGNRTALNHHGGYVTASWFLTGEQRGYDEKRGSYTDISPQNPFSLQSLSGSGAWEIATRYQTIDFNDDDLQAGELDAYSVNLNWYPNDDIKVMLQYTMNDLDNNALLPDADPQFLTLRAQWDF